jgi:hypothetical protein
VAPLMTILVKVYSGWITALPPAPTGVQAAMKGQYWFVAGVPVPDSSATGMGAMLTLAAWTIVGTGQPSLATVYFYGLEGGGDDCCAGSGLVGVAPPQLVRGVPLTLAPIVWSILATGFGAGAGMFNGTWTLTLRQILGGVCLWDNGGDGNGTPGVELCCESPLAQTWQLSFRTNSKPPIRYTLPADQWNTVSANVMSLSVSAGFPANAVPRSLTVKPG